MSSIEEAFEQSPTKPPFPTAIDSTMRATFSACPAKFRNSYLLKKSAATSSVHLVFGGAYAAGLEAMRRVFYEQGRGLSIAKIEGTEALLKHWIATGFDPEPEGTPKTMTRCVDAFNSYLVNFNPTSDYLRPAKLLEGSNDLAIEFTFALPIPGVFHPQTGEPLLYSGRFDMLAEGHGGSLYIVDDKTAGQLGKTFSNSMRLKSQFTGYTWACEQYGYKTAGIIIRATQALKTKIEHVELIEQRPPFIVKRWLEQLQWDARTMISMWQDWSFSHSYDEACGSYGGCEFSDACASMDEEGYLEAFYNHRDWDPLRVGEG